MIKTWIYENDENNNIRYVLGTIGKNPLYCFGINPSTAYPDNLDNTLKSVERISLYNGYDSWIMFNVYPKRDTKFEDLSKTINQEWHNKNLECIKRNLCNQDSVDVWAAWGNLIEKRSYMFDCLIDIYNLFNESNAKWLTTKVGKSGNPLHPLYQPKISVLQSFDMENYINAKRL